MNTNRFFAAILGLTLLILTQRTGNAQTPIISRCAELPFDSFPPNLLLREENSDGSAVSVLQSGKTGTWAEFFIEVDHAGTYRVNVGLLKGPDKTIFQLIVNGDPVGDPVDCYSGGAATPDIPIGDVTFLEAGNYSFRFVVTGKNPSSGGEALSLEQISLTPVQGFTLASPNGLCQPDSNVLLRWNAWPAARKYRVEVDGQGAATIDAPATTYSASRLAGGAHRWRVVALDAQGRQTPSNVFSFVVGPPPPFPCREFAEKFSSGNPDDWALEGMRLANESLQATGNGSAVIKDVRLDKTEGEMAAHFTLTGSDAAAGVGFQADDGTRLYAVADMKRQQLRIERRVTGPERYSIFDVTPKAYQVRGWAERTEGDSIIWEIAAKTIQIRPGAAYQLKLAYSRRSGCVMTTLIPSDGSPTVTLRDLTDLRTPDHPLLIALSGQAAFADVSLRLLNKLVYKWDPDSTRIVLRTGEPGTWDAKGAFNPAVIVRNGIWYMMYRGNLKAAPPNGPANSEIGFATSTDGIHWIKNPANPVIKRDSDKGTKEDPDLIWPKGSNQVFLEYVSRGAPGGELMRSSSDFIHWSAPWILNSGRSFGKIGGMIDTQAGPGIPGIQYMGASYRYIAMIEEGRIDLSDDLHQWIKAGTADLKGTQDAWCNYHECSGDIFVDSDKNIRFESQIGVNEEKPRGNAIVGNRLCTIGEGVLSGSDPTKVLWRSDLPWLTDWYGNAPTGAPEDFTATNGSVFPGQTIVKDGWLWHYSGGNNHCTLLTKCWYGPRMECRDLQVTMDASGEASVSFVVRNIGSLKGSGSVNLTIDGKQIDRREVVLDRDAETTLALKVPAPAGVHTLAVNNLAVTLQH